MYTTPTLLAKAEQLGGKELCERLQNDFRFQRLFMRDQLILLWGKQLHQWPNETTQNMIAKRTTRLPLPELEQKKYSLSDQKAAFNTFIFDLLAMLSWKAICERRRQFNEYRLTTARQFFREGSTSAQRVFIPSLLLLFEIFMPLLWLSLFIPAVLIRLVVQTGVRFPLLWMFYFTAVGSGINGIEALPPGENGYTKVYRGGHHVDLDELERELMERNSESSHNETQPKAYTICISYKHYANKGKVPGDDHRICRTDLQALAQLIKVAAPCNLRFWIDTKLPPTTDGTFERWLNRGVRPYGRYITFLCPSAQQYAESSFWLSNEYHFAAAGKGAMYFEGDHIFYDLRYGYQLDLHRRFLQILIEAERHPVQVRDEDKGKVIHWAMCCLRAEERGLQYSLSPNIDNLMMVGKYPHQMGLLRNIVRVIRKFGPQELPVSQGRSWNKDNPLLLAGVPHQEFDVSNWRGMSLDECPATVYFVHERVQLDIQFDTMVVLEVNLDRPHFRPGKIRVIRKVLRELSSNVLTKCKFVALPWLCDWE